MASDPQEVELQRLPVMSADRWGLGTKPGPPNCWGYSGGPPRFLKRVTFPVFLSLLGDSVGDPSKHGM